MSFVLLLLCVAFLLLLAVDLLTVLLSYSICWYEYANADPTLIDRRFSSTSLKLSLALILPELFFNLVTVLVIPFGLLNSKSHYMQRGETPVLLLHGLFDNQASWFWFRRKLKQQGIGNVVSLNLSSWHNEEVLTELLAKRVDELRHQLGVNRVHLVGHSMGGMIARNYIQLRGGRDKVDCLICLGSPHHGSKLAPFSLAPLGKQLIPGCDFLTRLNAAEIPEEVTLTNIYTGKDNMVLPNSNNHLSWGKAVALDGMGHTSLIYRKAPIDATIAALRKGERS